ADNEHMPRLARLHRGEVPARRVAAPALPIRRHRRGDPGVPAV
ncbi:MAG: hypothetical protein AVDCRST_MAG57-3147, partial [uncultured Blastococcus sp.]